MCFYSQATPYYRTELHTQDRVLYHIEVRTLYARRIFREHVDFFGGYPFPKSSVHY